MKEKKNKRLAGKLLLIAGLLTILAAAGMLGRWMIQRKQAEQQLSEIYSALTEAIPDEASVASDRMDPAEAQGPLPVMQINGVNCAGILEIDSLNRSWPIGGTDEQTKLLPCLRTYDDLKKQTESYLVIQGRDLPEQFSMLTQVEVGDSVRFTDMNGNRYEYTAAFAGSSEELVVSDSSGSSEERKCTFDLELLVDTADKHPLVIGCRLVKW